MTKLHILSTGNGRTSGDVVFVHGLGGDPFTTWQFDTDESWASWFAVDRPDLTVWSLGYDVQPTAWSGSAMPLADRAVNVLALLDGNGVGKRPVCFITHSMGGLLVKQLLRHASTITKEYRPVAASTRGVVFFSTPHAGADLASLLGYLEFFLRTTVAVKELEAHDHHLRELNLWYRNNVSDLDIVTRVFFETRKTRGVMVVNATSADPGLPGVTPIPVDSDHFEICCPSSKGDLRYMQTLKFLNERLPLPKDTQPDRFSPIRQRLLTASSPRDLRRLLHETDQLLVDSPHDPDGKQLRDDIQTALHREESAIAQASEDSQVHKVSAFAPIWPVVIALALLAALVMLFVG